jgi:hypothetical protein
LHFQGVPSLARAYAEQNMAAYGIYSAAFLPNPINNIAV